ncbi:MULTISPECIES: DUF4349 domain-containing protein [unclassified Streptomyces]|uniref:DUF4349 domain-containing protein n=1 Tax=unclassified Streptomyces TaxID=2593676 RepID=UPI0016602E5D|nr:MULTISPECIES: DUF4349 domain-containing protein [unclassified Streptomyces]MBD0709586.1 hypothetical protein [Streptomyces sp. CBMA291]MBD0714388.1 hypothetical protein [Streptomyces sp. CBMA370]
MTNVRGTRRARAAAGGALLTAALLLTGCAGGGETDSGKSDMSAARPADGPGAGDAAAQADGKSGTQTGTQVKPQARQHVIRTASLSVEVDDAAKALATARRVAAEAGGRVENERTERGDDTRMTSVIVLRVPQERYDAVLTELAGTGRLLARKADAKDVTDQVVDVESRIATQRASVARVRELMDRAEKLSDVVTLEGELSRRQADLEALLAQQTSLKDRTSLSTITLSLSEKLREEAEAPAEGRPGFGDALSGGWNALVGAAAWVGIVLAALAPWLVVAVVLFLLWRRLVRPRLAARRPAAPSPVRPHTPRNAAGAPLADGPSEASGAGAAAPAGSAPAAGSAPEAGRAPENGAHD